MIHPGGLATWRESPCFSPPHHTLSSESLRWSVCVGRFIPHPILGGLHWVSRIGANILRKVMDGHVSVDKANRRNESVGIAGQAHLRCVCPINRCGAIMPMLKQIHLYLIDFGS